MSKEPCNKCKLKRFLRRLAELEAEFGDVIVGKGINGFNRLVESVEGQLNKEE
tara:strand:+ start:7903 stop:8061 length:159 start_codon:yes stop_codon:yes gene_type:complete